MINDHIIMGAINQRNKEKSEVRNLLPDVRLLLEDLDLESDRKSTINIGIVMRLCYTAVKPQSSMSYLCRVLIAILLCGEKNSPELRN